MTHRIYTILGGGGLFGPGTFFLMRSYPEALSVLNEGYGEGWYGGGD